MHELNYEAPTSLDQAISVLAAAGENGRMLAGGTDLIIQMRAGVRQPGQVIDAKRSQNSKPCLLRRKPDSNSEPRGRAAMLLPTRPYSSTIRGWLRRPG